MKILANVTVKQAKTLLGRGYDDNVGMLITPLLKVDLQEVIQSGMPWAADNGAFSGFNPDRFKLFLSSIADRPRCLFVVCPDVVGDAQKTLEMFDAWRGEIEYAGQPVALALQDGQESLELPDADAYFVGGSTNFKLSLAADDLIVECHRRGKHVHMGRVNTRRRLKHAHSRLVDSVDGTCMRFAGFDYLVMLYEYMVILDDCNQVRRAPKVT
jgi:hypothetical protein